MIYVDMDGVVADFELWLSQFGNFTEDDWCNGGEPWAIMESNIDRLYLDLEPTDAFDFFNRLYITRDDVRFLSALPKSWYGTEYWDKGRHNKMSWLLEHIDGFVPAHLIVTSGAMGKLEYCERGAFLYDDRKDLIDIWNERGGNGIYVNGSAI